jgi:hypothetical protein
MSRIIHMTAQITLRHDKIFASTARQRNISINILNNNCYIRSVRGRATTIYTHLNSSYFLHGAAQPVHGQFWMRHNFERATFLATSWPRYQWNSIA